MYVCICHVLSDSDVQSAKKNGATRTCEVFDHFGVRPQCGRCVPTMCYLLKKGDSNGESHPRSICEKIKSGSEADVDSSPEIDERLRA